MIFRSNHIMRGYGLYTQNDKAKWNYSMIIKVTMLLFHFDFMGTRLGQAILWVKWIVQIK